MPWNEPLLPTAINANINTSAYADAFLSRIPSESRSDSTSSAQRRPLIGTSDMNSTYKKQDQLGEGTFGVVWRGQVIRDFEPTLRSDAWKKAAGLSALVLTSQGQVKRRRVEKGTVVALKQILHHQEFEGVRSTLLFQTCGKFVGDVKDMSADADHLVERDQDSQDARPPELCLALGHGA